jgi:hypothetical protein
MLAVGVNDNGLLGVDSITEIILIWTQNAQTIRLESSSKRSSIEQNSVTILFEEFRKPFFAQVRTSASIYS